MELRPLTPSTATAADTVPHLGWKHPIAAAAIAALTALACGAETPPPKQGPSNATAPLPEAPGPAAPPARSVTWSELSGRIAALAKGAEAAEAEALAKVLKGAGSDAKALKKLTPAGQLRFYDRQGVLNADGSALLAALLGLERQGIDRAGYRLQAIDSATGAIPPLFSAERAVWLSLERQPRAALVGAAAAAWLRGGPGSAVELARAGGEALGPAGLLALDRALDAIGRTATATRVALVQADAELTRAAIRHVVDCKFALPAHPIKHTPPAEIKRMADKFADEIAKVLDGARGRLGETIAALQPTHPQFALLLGAWDTYKRHVDAGGWAPLPKAPPKPAKKGDSGPFIAALRARLQAEGYDSGDGGDRFDDPLDAAIKLFQERHQLDADGVVSRTVIAELDVPADKRLRQIGLSLQRYRESEGRDPGDGFYVYVNLALQTLWVYDGGKAIDRHRVIIGNNDNDTDQLTMMKGKINRTKMFSHKMVRVILAPKWFPTSRVVELELQPKLAKDPGFLEKEGYVREMKPDGTEVWYQKAGKANLLGDVKFQGPNKFNIYLHDTPFRHLFSRARRPFSHGCVRVDKPIDLAELILGRDRDMSPREIRETIKEGEEKEIKLKTPIAVHIDYASAAVDADGNPVFGYDVYGYDQAFYDGALPVEEAKEFKASSVRGL